MVLLVERKSDAAFSPALGHVIGFIAIGIPGIDPYGICSILFILALTAVISFVRIDNAILQWLGKHCFPIYILQRIPMIALSNTALVNKSLLFTGIILVSSLLLAWVFTKVTDRLDAKLFA